ncbi:MAG: ATP-binding protein [Thermodesulfobacteriota bacterium]
MPKKKNPLKKLKLGCDECFHKGYLVEKNNDLARARMCNCIVNCQSCNGTGATITRNEKGYTYINPCGICGVIQRNVKLYNVAGIPAKYSHVLQVDTFQPRDKTHQYAISYAKEFVQLYPVKKGFLLMGAAGRGKTHLAIGTISEMTLERGVKCMFKDFLSLLSELKEAYSFGTSENEVIQPLVDTEILVIDELGKGRSNEWELNILDQLISKRYNASKMTLITTNYISKTEENSDIENNEILELRVGKRIASRLYELCEFIPLKGNDYRRKK